MGSSVQDPLLADSCLTGRFWIPCSSRPTARWRSELSRFYRNFVVRTAQQPCQLVIHSVRGNDLADQTGGGNNTYCVLRRYRNGVAVQPTYLWRSDVIKATVNPQWSFTRRRPRPFQMSMNETLGLFFYHEGASDVFLGKIDLNASAVFFLQHLSRSSSVILLFPLNSDEDPTNWAAYDEFENLHDVRGVVAVRASVTGQVQLIEPNFWTSCAHCVFGDATAPPATTAALRLASVNRALPTLSCAETVIEGGIVRAPVMFRNSPTTCIPIKMNSLSRENSARRAEVNLLRALTKGDVRGLIDSVAESSPQQIADVLPLLLLLLCDGPGTTALPAETLTPLIRVLHKQLVANSALAQSVAILATNGYCPSNEALSSLRVHQADEYFRSSPSQSPASANHRRPVHSCSPSSSFSDIQRTFAPIDGSKSPEKIFAMQQAPHQKEGSSSSNSSWVLSSFPPSCSACKTSPTRPVASPRLTPSPSSSCGRPLPPTTAPPLSPNSSGLQLIDILRSKTSVPTSSFITTYDVLTSTTILTTSNSSSSIASSAFSSISSFSSSPSSLATPSPSQSLSYCSSSLSSSSPLLSASASSSSLSASALSPSLPSAALESTSFLSLPSTTSTPTKALATQSIVATTNAITSVSPSISTSSSLNIPKDNKISNTGKSPSASTKRRKVKLKKKLVTADVSKDSSISTTTATTTTTTTSFVSTMTTPLIQPLTTPSTTSTASAPTTPSTPSAAIVPTTPPTIPLLPRASISPSTPTITPPRRSSILSSIPLLSSLPILSSLPLLSSASKTCESNSVASTTSSHTVVSSDSSASTVVEPSLISSGASASSFFLVSFFLSTSSTTTSSSVTLSRDPSTPVDSARSPSHSSIVALPFSSAISEVREADVSEVDTNVNTPPSSPSDSISPSSHSSPISDISASSLALPSHSISLSSCPPPPLSESQSVLSSPPPNADLSTSSSVSNAVCSSSTQSPSSPKTSLSLNKSVIHIHSSPKNADNRPFTGSIENPPSVESANEQSSSVSAFNDNVLVSNGSFDAKICTGVEKDRSSASTLHTPANNGNDNVRIPSTNSSGSSLNVPHASNFATLTPSALPTLASSPSRTDLKGKTLTASSSERARMDQLNDNTVAKKEEHDLKKDIPRSQVVFLPSLQLDPPSAHTSTSTANTATNAAVVAANHQKGKNVNNSTTTTNNDGSFTSLAVPDNNMHLRPSRHDFALPTPDITDLFNLLRAHPRAHQEGLSFTVSKRFCVFHPFNTSQSNAVTEVVVERVIASAATPLLLSLKFKNEADRVLFKCGDDLRLDMAVMQTFRVMNELWAQNELQYDGVAVRARTYGIVALTPSMGLVEFVEGCGQLKNIADGSFSSGALTNMVASAAGAYVAAYVLKIRDRHFDNILVHRDGWLFHIDFSHILGASLSLDTSEFAITSELYSVLGPTRWPAFVETCVQAFSVLRRNFEVLKRLAIALFLPFEGFHVKLDSALRDTLMIRLPEAEAVESLKVTIEKAPFNLKTKIKNVIHELATTLDSGL